MRPYYEADGITIYHGDCREMLPNVGLADLVLTDPPYGLHVDSWAPWTGKGVAGPRVSRLWANPGWDERPSAKEIGAVVAAGHLAIVWGGNYFDGLDQHVLDFGVA